MKRPFNYRGKERTAKSAALRALQAGADDTTLALLDVLVWKKPRGHPYRISERNPSEKMKREKAFYAPLRAKYTELIRQGKPRKVAMDLCVKAAMAATGLKETTVRREGRFADNKRRPLNVTA